MGPLGQGDTRVGKVWEEEPGACVRGRVHLAMRGRDWPVELPAGKLRLLGGDWGEHYTFFRDRAAQSAKWAHS